MNDELDGVELSRAVARVEKCEHEYETEIRERWTADARKETVRVHTCKKCGNWKREIVQKENIDENAFWR